MANIEQAFKDMLDGYVERWITTGHMTSRQHLVLLVPDDWPQEQMMIHHKKVPCIRCADIPSIQGAQNEKSTTVYLLRRVDYTRMSK